MRYSMPQNLDTFTVWIGVPEIQIAVSIHPWSSKVLRTRTTTVSVFGLVRQFALIVGSFRLGTSLVTYHCGIAMAGTNVRHYM